jgi:hypothetical protein
MKIYGIIVAILIVLLGGYWYSHYRATQAANNGDTISPDNSVTTSLAAPDPTPVPAATATPAKRTPMPGSTAVSTPTPVATTQTSLSTETSAAPASDTIDRTPPNGMVFAGTGHIQVYRQGNITWRINTDTGDACVLFATDREWRKPRVYSAGCRKG